jgi:TM2 domain-containing membrane protein YozV
MNNSKLILFFITLIISQSIFSQGTDLKEENKKILAPAKAAFFSAILPGLGQAYNKKYWKIPIVYGAIGTGIYFHNQNNKSYKRYRGAYKRRLAGFSDDEFWGTGVTPNISNDGLIRAQKQLKRNKEMSILVTIGLYALNIIDANVDAHLMQYNIDDNLSLSPIYNFNEVNSTSNLSLSLKLKL